MGQRRKWQAEVAQILCSAGGRGASHTTAVGLRSGKGAWLGSHQNPAKMSGGLDKTNQKRLIHLVSQSDPPWCSLYQIMMHVLLELFLYDIVHPGTVLSFTPSSKKDEYYCQQQLVHKQSLSKLGIIWCQVLQSNVARRQQTRVLRHSYGFTSLFLPPEILHDFCHIKMLPCCAVHMDS